MDKPDVDFIEGLSPAISIDQKSASRNPRSTVGTITEIYDYLRLLYARIGVPHCPNDGTVVTRQTPQQIVDRILELPDKTRFQVLAPVVRGRKGEYGALLDELAGQGFVRARVDGEMIELSERKDVKLARYEQHTIEVVVDRLVSKAGIERRLTDSLETALRLAEGVAEVQIMDGGADEEVLTFSQHLACPTCGRSFDELAPRNFSFNSPYGACASCSGLGTRYEVDPELVVPNPDLSIDEGAVAPWAGARSEWFQRVLSSLADAYAFSTATPFRKLKKAQQKLVLFGTGGTAVQISYRNRYGRTRQYSTQYEGVVPWLTRRHGEAESDSIREQIEGYMREVPCPACDGARLKPESLAVTIGGRNVFELCDMSVARSGERSRRARALGTRPHDCRTGPQGGQCPAFLSARRRPRLPDPQPLRRDAGRRGGATDPLGLADRQRPRRSSLRARRALDRAAPAGQRPAHRDADPDARPRQHRDRGRARRGDDPGGRPCCRHRARGRRARRAHRGGRHGR